jgi:hypothetical protein
LFWWKHYSSNVFLDRSVYSFWVEAIRRTKLLGSLKLASIEVDGDGFGGTGHLGSLDHGESLRKEKQLSICSSFRLHHDSRQNKAMMRQEERLVFVQALAKNEGLVTLDLNGSRHLVRTRGRK